MPSNNDESPTLPGVVRAAVEGDAKAQRQVLLSLHRRVRNVAYYLVGRHPDVDDFVQLALMEIARALPSFRGESKIERWADRITHRTVMAQLKRKRIDARPTPTGDNPEVPSEDLSPDRVEDARRIRQQMVVLFDRLKPEKREVVVMRLVLGHSIREIAEITGAPPETVRTRLRVARRQLAQAIQADPTLAIFAERLR